MINKQLVDYIKEQLGQGVAKEMIKDSLLARGYAAHEITMAFAVAESKNYAAIAESIGPAVISQFSPKKIDKKFVGRTALSKRWLKILIGLGVLGIIICRYFFYVDLGSRCRISISPSILEFNNLTVKRSIDILKYGSPSDYRDLCKYVGKINPNISCGGFGGGCFRNSEFNKGGRTIDVSTANGSLLWTAAVIVHETCHARQLYEKRGFSETECYDAMDETLKRIVQI